MSFTQKSQRGLALLMLMALLVSMFALTAYASAKEPYDFDFNFQGGPRYSKSVYKDDGGYSAGASILRSNFGGGSVQFQLQRTNGSDLSYWTSPIREPGNNTLYYYSNVDLSYKFYVRLAGQATSSVGSIGGNFQP